MNNPSQTQNPRGGLSSTAFVPDMSAILQSQSPNRSKVEEWQNDDEENRIPTVIKVKTSSPPKTEQSPKKKTAYNHQNNATVLAIKKWYKIRGWSLLYPLIVSLYLVITEMNVNLRAAGYGLVIFCCIWCYLNLKNFHPQKNLAFSLMIVACMLVALTDFLEQFSIIGNKGWAAVGSYQNCFHFKGEAHNKKLHDNLCTMFKAVYYLNALFYVCTLWSFLVYLVATSKLMKLTSYVTDGNGFRTRLEDEIDVEADDDNTMNTNN